MRFEVAKSQLADTRLVAPAGVDLGPDQARVRVDSFGLTANNVTYAVFGAAMQYWDFFPTAEPETWGCIPVWGFADVVESTVGRLYPRRAALRLFPDGVRARRQRGSRR